MKFFIPIAVAVFLLALLGIKFNQSDSTNEVLRVVFPGRESAQAYDPAQIRFDNQYVFLQNLYSPLVEDSETGTPIPSVAQEFTWKGSELHFVLRPGLKTIDGHPITAQDALLSFKRLIILSKNTHGDFKTLVCPDTELKNLKDDCPNMIVKDNTLILKLQARRDFVVDMLISMDFAIIPRKSFDPATLKITDYRNTSGPYYVAKDDAQGRIILKANPAHFHFKAAMPRKIQLIPTKGKSSGEVATLFNQNQIDHISTIEWLSVGDLKKINSDQAQFHQTVHIQMALAHVSKEGKKNIPTKKRIAFARALQKGFADYCAQKEGCRPTQQFFLPSKESALASEEERIFQEAMSVDMESSGAGISLGIYASSSSGLEEYIKAAKSYMPNLKAEEAESIPAFSKSQDNKVPDYIIVFTDSGFLEEIGLLSYSMKSGIFGLSQKEGKAWLKDYMNTAHRPDRIKKIKKLHLEALTRGWTIPLYRTPYVAAIRKPWKMHFPKNFANNPFWKIRKD